MASIKRSLSLKSWAPSQRTLLTLAAAGLFIFSALWLKSLPNSVMQFVGVQDRTPTVYSARYLPQIILLIIGLVALGILLNRNVKFQTAVASVTRTVSRRWYSLPKVTRKQIAFVLVLVLIAVNLAKILLSPYIVDVWDTKVQAFVGAKAEQLNIIIEGLRAGCMLCTPSYEPIEHQTQGDDIGLFFVFGLLTKAGVPASFEAFRMMNALAYT
jgi:hypothetical protein